VEGRVAYCGVGPDVAQLAYDFDAGWTDVIVLFGQHDHLELGTSAFTGKRPAARQSRDTDSPASSGA
jgi:hypothetical protein